MFKGIVISGEFGKILVREKSDASFELGELLIGESGSSKMLLQVYDLLYGSQISQQNLELVAGMHLEEGSSLEFMDKSLRTYNLALIKSLITIKDRRASISKSLPIFFSKVREVESDDISFLTRPKNPLVLGKLRSGSKLLDVDIALQADQALSHHILISGTTGRGKSVLLMNLLWNSLDTEFCGILVLDPHDEYFGKNGKGLKDHHNKEKLCYYSARNPPIGQRTLVINLSCVKPYHLQGVVQWSDPQEQALTAFYRHFGDSWIENLLLDQKVPNFEFMEGTINVLKRRLQNILSLSVVDGRLFCDGIFAKVGGAATIDSISKDLEDSRIVIVDTSMLAGDVEILVGSLIASEVFGKYRNYKTKGLLKDKPVISIVLEEAPRVLGKDVLERGPNIFSTIAREGRKFKVGLAAITQLPSQIPRDILANINTKIVLGLEMKMERQAIIESASQDLSDDDRNIASLDVGEAIVTSNFIKFATPIKIPSFDDKILGSKQKTERKDFSVLK